MGADLEPEMFQFHSADLSKIEDEYRATVEDVHLLLLRVMDRHGIVSDNRYEFEAGIMILAMAGLGKLRLFERAAVQRGLALPDGELQQLLTQLQQSWVQYWDEFRADAEAELRDQFAKFVSALELSHDRKETLLTDIHDVAYFFGQRDIMELFLEELETLRGMSDFHRQVERLDSKVRRHLSETVANGVYDATTVEQWLAVRWLPPKFWWRHIEWRIRQE